jgi:cyclopropane fatty-acyl-phospholipid synthase-like methyltransferase
MAGHLCPWWLGYFHLGPLRRFIEKPRDLLEAYVKEGMTAVDIGSGMGFFTLEMARLVGPGGRIVAIDLQPRMIGALERRARRAGLSDRIEARVCTGDSLESGDLAGKADFVTAFYVAHEVGDLARFFEQAAALLAQRGRFLLAEPKGHVSASAFEEELAVARGTGLSDTGRSETGRRHAAILERP